MFSPPQDASGFPYRGTFETTPWSLILEAKEAGGSRTRKALNELCRAYRYPIYCFVRSAGYQHADAEDLVQGFFCQLLDRDFFSQASSERGRLRSFLLASLRFYLRDARRRALAAKRGGTVDFVPLDLADAEQRFAELSASGASAEQLMDRAWALEVLQKAMEALRVEWVEQGRGELFAALRPYIVTQLHNAEADEIAARFGRSQESVKTTLHRLRKDYGLMLRGIVAETVDSRDSVEAEIAALRAAL